MGKFPDQLLADACGRKFQQLRDLWNRKEAWAGCSELDENLNTGWEPGTKLSLAVLRQLGRNGILTIQLLQNTYLAVDPDSWIILSDLRRCHWEISEKEYQTFLEWVRAAGLRRSTPADVLGPEIYTSKDLSSSCSPHANR